MQKIFIKIKDKWWFFLVFLIVSPLVSRLIDKIKISHFSNISISSVKIINNGLFLIYQIYILLLNLLKIKVSLFGLLIGLITSVLLLRVYKKYFVLRKRNLRVLDAWYGTNEKNINIARELNDSIVDNKLMIVLSNNISGDPISGVEKAGYVKYNFNGKEFDKRYKENEVIEIP
jgi:hypothetical protein